MDRLTLEVPCDLRYRDAAGAVLQHLCLRLEQEGEPSGLRHQVVSAFNEAFNNLAQHAGAQAGTVRIAFEIGGGVLAIEMRDRGPAFDYQEVAPPDLDQLPESGLGIFIMRSFMTEVCYSPGQGGENVLRMVRQLGAATNTSPPR